MTITLNLLDAGLDPLDEHTYELGGLLLKPAKPGDKGLDDLGENEGDEEESAGDGRAPLELSMSPRAIELSACINAVPAGGLTAGEVFEESLRQLRIVQSLLPYRQGTRLLRWRRTGAPAKRIAVQPAIGQALRLSGIEDGAEGGVDRMVLHHQTATLRLTAPDPIILSDVYHRATFTAGQTQTIVNQGTLTALMPTAWWLDAPTGGTIENLDFDESIYFPHGPVTVSRALAINGPTGSYGQAYGPGGKRFPRVPLLRPGNNTIRASRACTLYWRDTY